MEQQPGRLTPLFGWDQEEGTVAASPAEGRRAPHALASLTSCCLRCPSSRSLVWRVLTWCWV